MCCKTCPFGRVFLFRFSSKSKSCTAKSCCFLFRRFLPEQLLILFQLQNWISLKPVSVTIFRTSLKWFFPSDISRHQNERYRFGWLKRYVCSKQLQVGKNERKEKTQRQLFKHWDISSFVFSFFSRYIIYSSTFFSSKKKIFPQQLLYFWLLKFAKTSRKTKLAFCYNVASFERHLNDSSLQILVDIKTNDIALVGWNDMFAVSSFKLKKWKERKNAEATLQTSNISTVTFVWVFRFSAPVFKTE